MSTEELEMFIKYPLISVVNMNNYKIYKGHIRLHDRDVKIKFQKTNSLQGTCQYEIEELDILTEEMKPSLNQLQTDSVVNFLDNLCAQLNPFVKTIENFTHLYRKILLEYNEFTNFFLTLNNCELCNDLRLIKVSMVDDKHRIHSSEITIDYTQQNIFHFSVYDLPHSFQPNSSLVELYNEYVSTIEALQQYFDLMDVLDKNTEVLDPCTPKRADTYRRIWLGENLSVLITIDPLKLYCKPDIKFLGPDRLVDEYQKKLNDNLEKWEIGGDVFNNLFIILGISNFPLKESESEVNQYVLRDTGDCAICFSARLNEKLPDVICANKSCENFYHTECLYEWLMSINSRRIFNEIHGQCPNCEKDIACGIPSFVES